MPRTYVDNAYNRSVGRVGMEHGTAVISRSSGVSGGGSYSSSSYSGGGGGGGYSGGGSGRSYVDNAMNRSLGRVGLPLGSAVHSSSGNSNSSSHVSNYSDSGSSSRAYVDNAMNRSLGRVGLPVGSAVHSTSNSMPSSSSSGTKIYVDNSMNRSLNRVGLPLGSAVQSSVGSAPARISSSAATRVVGAGCYVGNAYNRRLGRVGLPLGAAVVKSSNSSTSNNIGGGGRTYVDNPMNRKLGRVGKVVGTAIVTTTSASRIPRGRSPLDDVFKPLFHIDPEDNNLGDILRQIEGMRDDLRNNVSPDPAREHNAEAAIGIIYRHEAAITRYRTGLQPPEWVRGGEVIDFKQIELGEKLGSGGFGDVHVGIWKGNLQVAIKKLRVQRVSQKKKEEFQQEVKVFSSLDHPCIVKFFGACVNPPNLAIVMEFMGGGSLHDVLHVEMRSLTSGQKSQMVTDALSALMYMHETNMAHRDIKSMNIMVCDDYSHCKLGDFGLALKEEARSSASVADHSVVGTLLYSPPEVVAGQRLNISGLMSADVYSVTIVIIELLTGGKPYERMNQHQVRAAILNKERPSLTSLTEMNEEAKELLRQGMSSRVTRRPSAAAMYNTWSTLTLLNQLGSLTLDDFNNTTRSGRGPVVTPGTSQLSLGVSLNDNGNATFLPSQGSGSGTNVSNSIPLSSSTSSTRRRSCPVCMSEGIGYVFHCGHAVCESCYLRLNERDNCPCPICRRPIVNAIQLYLS